MCPWRVQFPSISHGCILKCACAFFWLGVASNSKTELLALNEVYSIPSSLLCHCKPPNRMQTFVEIRVPYFYIQFVKNAQASYAVWELWSC